MSCEKKFEFSFDFKKRENFFEQKCKWIISNVSVM